MSTCVEETHIVISFLTKRKVSEIDGYLVRTYVRIDLSLIKINNLSIDSMNGEIVL